MVCYSNTQYARSKLQDRVSLKRDFHEKLQFFLKKRVNGNDTKMANRSESNFCLA